MCMIKIDETKKGKYIYTMENTTLKVYKIIKIVNENEFVTIQIDIHRQKLKIYIFKHHCADEWEIFPLSYCFGIITSLVSFNEKEIVKEAYKRYYDTLLHTGVNSLAYRILSEEVSKIREYIE